MYIGYVQSMPNGQPKASDMVSESSEGGLGETRSFKVLSPGTMISHYKILGKIGEGGMGVVYKATDTKLGRTVALKFLPSHLLCDTEARERFEHEAKAASALNHLNIATIHEIDEVEGRCFIVMEYLDGGSLKGFLEKKAISVKDVLDVAIQIGEGLAAAHESGVVHRDIKPDNIMLTGRAVPKIMDFGLAKLKGVTRVTKTGTTLGTLQYMSPEQAEGKEVDGRSDIFSFGVIVYEMVTGRRPFGGDSEAAVINAIINDAPEPMARYKAGVPEGLQRIVDRALAKDVGERYQHADEVVAELRHEKRLLETGASAAGKANASRRPSRRLLRFVIPALIAGAVILLIFIFEPFRLEVGPGKEAAARENSLAIMYFENIADREDPERLGEIITMLLITDLSESQYMSVVSSQRLYDILKLLGKEGTKVVDRNVASEVATKAGAKWMMLGSIVKSAPQVVIATQLVNVETGKVEASQRITGESGEEVFSLVDRLSAEIKQDLALPAAAREEVDRPVADGTTHSPEAYRHYVEALDYESKYYFPEARSCYERALDYDSTFAMAYYGLAYIQWVQGIRGYRESIDRAVKYSDKVSEKERNYIIAMAAGLSGNYARAIKELEKIAQRYPDDKEAPMRMGLIQQENLKRPQDAIPHFERVTEIDPLHKLAYNQLAYCYNDIGDFDRSIWAINKYISLAPDEANPYDSRGDLYALNGRFDLAIESYTKSLEMNPDFTYSRQKLGHMYLVKRDYAKAEASYKELSSSTDKVARSTGRTCLAVIPMYQGKFEEALRVLDDGLAADRMEGAEESWQSALKHASKAEIYRARQDFNSALREWEHYMRIPGGASYTALEDRRCYYASLLAESGQTARAREVARAMKQDTQREGQAQMQEYSYALGCVELAEGNTEEGLINLEKAAAGIQDVWVRYTLAKAYLESDRLAEAVAGFEKVISTILEETPVNGVQIVKAHYLLGIAYEESSWDTKAIEQYEEFLEIWKDAEPGMPEVEDARLRLAKLKQAS